MKVALNDFIDFLLAPGPQRPALVGRLVRASRSDSNYNPTKNFWHQLRQAFRRYWRDGGNDVTILMSAVETAVGPKKSRFERAAKGFLKYRGRKALVWEEPPVLHWRHKDLDVSCSPDLGLTDGTRHWLIRLHYQPAPPSRARVTAIGAVIATAASRAGLSDAAPALLDLDRGSLRQATLSRAVADGLELEADALIAYWQRYEAS